MHECIEIIGIIPISLCFIRLMIISETTGEKLLKDNQRINDMLVTTEAECVEFEKRLDMYEEYVREMETKMLEESQKTTELLLSMD